MTVLAAEWLRHPASQALCGMLLDAGYQAWFVGGCVRDALLGKAVSDLDLATDARPDVVADLAGMAGFRAIPTGIDHGTVTVVIDGRPFEVTTFRKDVETDGRRAVVAFSDKLSDDAHRRDFTMNALYAGADGRIVDPLDGLPDLRAGRVRFIDDPNARIVEDYLRILRFFRFTAWYGDPDQGIDSEGLAACAAGVEGIARLSKERIGHEMLRLLAAPDPAPAVAAMAATGVLAAVLPGADHRTLPVLVHNEKDTDLDVDPIARLACIGGADPMANLRLSKSQSRRRDVIVEGAASDKSADALGYEFGAADARAMILLRASLAGQPIDLDQLRRVDGAAKQVFPVKAADLADRFTGRDLGTVLGRLERTWVDSGFRATRTDLLKNL